MTIAAAAMCAAFTSCSHDFDSMSQEELNNLEAEQIVNAYNQAFIKTFGQPAANQDWGFGTTVTRTYNVQGNLWHEPKPQGFNLEYDAKVTTEEKNLVFNYVNNPTQVETVDQISFTQYWVTQIWNGKNDANAEGVKAPATETYPDQNGAKTTIVGGGNMDQLRIKETANGDWVHCNNFNAANNENYKEEGLGGRTLMISSGTYSFQYINSDGSHYSTKYIIVPGEKIHSSLAGFYYVCFDFEKGYTAEEQAAETSYGTCEIWKPQPTDRDPNAGYWQKNENWNLPGFYKDASSAELKALLEAQKGTKVQNITFKGYREGNHHCAGDGNYTDWIVRISPAREISSSDYDVRIIAEDLTATAEEKSDWDFNDVVFDVKFTSDDAAEITLVAAGGTLPLIVGVNNPEDDKDYYENEVHYLFGVPVNYMVNTNAEAKNLNGGAPENAAPKLNLTIPGVKASNGKLIPIHVKKSLKGGGKHWFELTAEKGHPASKLAVNSKSSKFTICDEREYILTRYPNFLNWVVNNDPLIWWE